MSHQQGVSLLSMVVMILLAGALLLRGSQQQLSSGVAMVAANQTMIQQFAAASSALSWGGRLTWPEASRWQCQAPGQWAWRACLCILPSGEGLLRGDSGERTLALWRWATWQQGKLRLQPQGWIDYYPLEEYGECGFDEF